MDQLHRFVVSQLEHNLPCDLVKIVMDYKPVTSRDVFIEILALLPLGRSLTFSIPHRRYPMLVSMSVNGFFRLSSDPFTRLAQVTDDSATRGFVLTIGQESGLVLHTAAEIWAIIERFDTADYQVVNWTMHEIIDRYAVSIVAHMASA